MQNLHRTLTYPVALLILACTPVVAAGQSIDSRLSTVRKAFIVAADDLGDDRLIAGCVSERLTKATPITIVVREEADVILTIVNGSVGKHPKAEITAALPDGTLLWSGKSKKRGFNLVGRNMTCPIADDLVGNLRKAMQKARDQKATR